MNWIEESRRTAFESSERIRADKDADPSGIRPDLDCSLPEDLRLRAVAIGNELILSYVDALSVIRFATENDIAVLGFDSGEVLEDGFQVLDYSGYEGDIQFTGDWKGYVAAINAAALSWITGHPLGKNHGYVLTSTSEKEFAQLRNSGAQ